MFEHLLSFWFGCVVTLLMVLVIRDIIHNHNHH